MEINEFNFFIQEMKIEDIPMVGRRFTWYKSNSHCKSRLDRCLVSKSWLEAWSGSTSFVLKETYWIIARLS